MAEFTLVLGNKNYSSWSLRPWLAMKQAGADFDEVVIGIGKGDTSERIGAHSPSRKVPALKHGKVTVWESLAICEYVAELFPKAGLWPADRDARAVARAAAAEMHAGFAALRGAMPMNLRVRLKEPRPGWPPEVVADVGRIVVLWNDCRARFGRGGPFLFGTFTNADAMFAPVVGRFRTYRVALPADAQAYCDAVWSWPAMREWVAAAEAENETIAKYDAIVG